MVFKKHFLLILILAFQNHIFGAIFGPNGYQKLILNYEQNSKIAEQKKEANQDNDNFIKNARLILTQIKTKATDEELSKLTSLRNFFARHGFYIGNPADNKDALQFLHAGLTKKNKDLYNLELEPHPTGGMDIPEPVMPTFISMEEKNKAIEERNKVAETKAKAELIKLKSNLEKNIAIKDIMDNDLNILSKQLMWYSASPVSAIAPFVEILKNKYEFLENNKSNLPKAIATAEYKNFNKKFNEIAEKYLEITKMLDKIAVLKNKPKFKTKNTKTALEALNKALLEEIKKSLEEKINTAENTERYKELVELYNMFLELEIGAFFESPIKTKIRKKAEKLNLVAKKG